MTEPKLPPREALIAARERLGALADRLARARARLDGSGVPKPLPAAGLAAGAVRRRRRPPHR